MDSPDKSEYVVAGIAAIILLEALTVTRNKVLAQPSRFAYTRVA